MKSQGLYLADFEVVYRSGIENNGYVSEATKLAKKQLKVKKFLNAIIVLIAFHSNSLISQEVEETVVITSALVDTSEITNPLYVIDGEDVTDDATTSLGDAIDSYLGVSIADYGAAVGQPIIRGMSGPRVKILKNGMVNRDVSGLGVDHLNDVDLTNKKGNIMILNFWATWCAPCKREMPSLEKLTFKYPEIKVFAVNTEKPNKIRIRDFFRSVGVTTLNTYYDPDLSLVKTFKLRGLPTSILIDKNGEEFGRVIGEVDFASEDFLNLMKKYI